MNHQKAFSLIEVLIFVTILSIFFVLAAAVTIASLRNMKVNEHKILATYYAEELVEWLRDEKEADWTAFSQKSGTYCFNSSDFSGWPIGACGNNYDLDSFFKRELILSNDGSQANINVTVSWLELGQEYQVPIATVFTKWED